MRVRPVPPGITDAIDSLGAASGVGNVYLRPLKRARTTFQYLAVATLGSDDDKRSYRD